MSLDKQKILNELGSVMNQLQSADCGCMGKLFSNSNQGAGGGQAPMGAQLPTCGGCRRDYCHGHGYNTCNSGVPGAGEPYSMNPNNMNPKMNRPCMGHCNPSKLYADTYNYLNGYLMQPVVNEVYNDLKSLTPANTKMNNPAMAAKMGLNQGIPGAYANPRMGEAPNDAAGGNMQSMPMAGRAGNMQPMPMDLAQSPMNKLGGMGGMGPEIVKMIMGEGGNQKMAQQMPGQGDQMAANTLQGQGQMGMPATNMNQNQLAANANPAQFNENANMRSYGHNPTAQFITQPNVGNGQPCAQPTIGAPNSIQNNVPMSGNMAMGNSNPNQMGTPNPRRYGQHTQGITKFNEMFPGVMQGGDLGFDPMAIAIQMNPANQQQAAMETMNKIMNNDLRGLKGSVPPNAQLQQNNLAAGQSVPAQQNLPAGQVANQQVVPGQQQFVGNTGAIPQQQQQAYTAVTGAPVMNQQPANPQQQKNQYMVDPNTGAIIMPTTQSSDKEGMVDHNGQNRQAPATSQPDATPPAAMVKEPIFPADTSRKEYNTLGQPVQMVPAYVYQSQNPGLPQTLSPQPVPANMRHDPTGFKNVKSTVSKTSLMGNKPTSRTPSRSQLQQIYNQYKGSQSYTQQSFRTPMQGATISEGNLNDSQGNTNAARAPVEKVGGDTLANNNQQRINEKVEQVLGEVGDVPAPNKPQGDNDMAKMSPGTQARQARSRNGLQDVVYTSYPTSAAWSFHGKHETPAALNRFYK